MRRILNEQIKKIEQIAHEKSLFELRLEVDAQCKKETCAYQQKQKKYPKSILDWELAVKYGEVNNRHAKNKK